MLKRTICDNELLKAIHSGAHIESVDEVKTAYLERDGEITVIPKPTEPRIVDVKVEEGVQTVRIVL